jgi:hypothetical protein
MNTKLLKRLRDRQDAIIFESEEDEGAAEFYGELQSVIDAIESGKSEAEVKAACSHVGETYE